MSFLVALCFHWMGQGPLLSLEITKLAGLVRQFVMGYSFSVSRALRLQGAAIPTHFQTVGVGEQSLILIP